MPRRQQIEEMLKSEPDDVFLHYALAMACISEGDNQSALLRLTDVTRRDPDYVAAYFQRGKLLTELGDTDDARAVIKTGIEAARRVGDTHAEGEMRGFLELLE